MAIFMVWIYYTTELWGKAIFVSAPPRLPRLGPFAAFGVSAHRNDALSPVIAGTPPLCHCEARPPFCHCEEVRQLTDDEAISHPTGIATPSARNDN